MRIIMRVLSLRLTLLGGVAATTVVLGLAWAPMVMLMVSGWIARLQDGQEKPSMIAIWLGGGVASIGPFVAVGIGWAVYRIYTGRFRKSIALISGVATGLCCVNGGFAACIWLLSG